MPVPEHEKRTTQKKLLFWLPWISGLVLVAGAVAFLVAHYGTTDKQGPSTLSNVPASKPLANGKPISQKIPSDARTVAAEFIKTAVARKNLPQAWKLTHPELRGGTYKEWLTGNIPVIPYPVGTVDSTLFKVTEQYPNELLIDVALIPKPGVKQDPALFAMGLLRVGQPGHKHWLVNYWMTKYAPPFRAVP